MKGKSWLQRQKDDLPWIRWSIGVLALFIASWGVAPIAIFQLVLNIDLPRVLALTAVGAIILTVGALYWYLPRLDPGDSNDKDITNLKVCKDLMSVVLWPLVMFCQATRATFENRMRTINIFLNSSRQ